MCKDVDTAAVASRFIERVFNCLGDRSRGDDLLGWMVFELVDAENYFDIGHNRFCERQVGLL